MSNQLKLVRNDNFLDKLQSNLNSLGINTKNNKEDILDKAEDLIKSKAKSSETKGIPYKRMFNIPNMKEKITLLEGMFSQVDSGQEFNNLKK